MDRMIVAMYLRLSNEDSDKGKFEESNSISAQRVLLKKKHRGTAAGAGIQYHRVL